MEHAPTQPDHDAEDPAGQIDDVGVSHGDRMRPEDRPQGQPVPDGNDEALLRDVLAFLRTRTGHDFSCYKRATILRRIGRRMQVNGVDDLSAYLGCLRTRPGEAGALLQDLLVSVTQFFRDGDCFEALAARIPELFRDKGPNDVVRAWVAACATGEEAYTVAILLAEHARTLDSPPLVQVFATDLDEDAIRVAREGVYPTVIEADVTEDRLRRFFVKEHRGYRVRPEVREMVVFAMHDLLRDSPFSRLDLVTCRNLLIYLDRDAQGRALDIFHFALRPAGMLLLGSSESVEDGSPLFSVVDKKHRLFRQRPMPRSGLPVPSRTPALALESQRALQERLHVAGRSFHAGPATERDPQAAAEARPVEPLGRQLEREIERLESLQRDTVEQYEASTEELKASNEELQAMNEELRSATEELETSREELQSINEELTTVNHELKSKVDELGQANSDMHNLMDATAIATIFLDRQLHITRYTPPAVALFNLLATDVGRPLTDLKSRLRYASLAEDAQRVVDSLVAVEREVGERGGHWFLARLRPYRTIDDRIAGVVLTFVDITERKLAEEAQLNAEARFRAIVDQATVGVLQIDPEGRVAFANQRMGRMLGRGEAELAGVRFESLVWPADLPLHRQLMVRLAERREPFEVEKRLLRRDGTAVWVHNSVAVLPDTHGEADSTVAVFVDITERKQAEEALRSSEEHLRMVIENAREFAIFTTDTERRITSWNPGAERLLGYSENEAVGRLGDVIFTDEDQAAGVPQREARQAAAEGRASDDRWHQRKDGSRLWVSGVLNSMHDGAGRLVGFVKILRDQTAMRRTQQELERALADNESARVALEAAHVAKDRFLAVLSHELRTPLTPAVTAVQLLSRRKDLPAEVHDMLQLIHRNVRMECHLIDDLLDITRIVRGTLEMARQPVELHAVIRTAVEVCDADVRAKQQQLTLALAAPQDIVQGDAQRLQQVVWNLLKNASKFTPAGGQLRVATAVRDGWLHMEVSDNGIGIEPEALTRIFETFTQGGDWVAREFGGLGLGLSISKATVESHGGRLWAESAGPGQGATFIMELPQPAS